MSASSSSSSSCSNRLPFGVLVVVPFGCAFVGGVAISLIRRRRKAERLRSKHEQKIRQWCEKQEREQTLKEQFRHENQEYCAKESVGRYRVDVRCAYKLWEEGRTLGCNPQLLGDVLALLVPEWWLELEECLSYMDTNFTYEQKLHDIVGQVEETGAEHLMIPLWARVKTVQRCSWRRNFKQFLKLMLVGSRMRLLSMLTTTTFSVALAQIGSQQSCCREGLLQAIIASSSISGQELLGWFAQDLGMTYLGGIVIYVAESLKAYLVKQSSWEMWRLFYTKLVSFDSEIYDKQDVTNYLNLEDAISDAEAAIQTFVQCAVDLATRSFMIYSRGGLQLTLCVFTFWSVSYCFKKPLDQLRDMLAKSDFVGRHDEDELDEDDEWVDEDALKEDMRGLFEYIRTVRAFGRDKDIMDSMLKKKLGKPSGRFLELDEFLGYTFPPVKDWILLSIELLCRYVCHGLLQRGMWLPCCAAEMHIMIREMWGALGTAPHSLSPHFVLNHVTQVATVMNILDYDPVIEKEGGLQLETLQGVLDLHNVSFAYPSRRDRKVISNLSFRAEPGKMTGLVGASGSGKSTVFALLMRFYDPVEGRILLDGRDLREYDVRWLRSKIGEVTQNSQLFEMSVEDNIRFGCVNATREEVVEAAKLANAYRFIMALPEGFNTILGDNAIRLSGGQMQRISISRAFLSRPRILLLDEYSSALDTQSEVEVQTAVERLVERGCTVLVIAHRLRTVERAAKIVVLDRGTCVENGTHEELLHRNGVYTTLDTLQQKGSPSNMHLTLSAQQQQTLPKNTSFGKLGKKKPSVSAGAKEEEDELFVRCRTPASSPRQAGRASEPTISNNAISIRLIIANIFQAHAEKLGLLKSELVPQSWEWLMHNKDPDEVLHSILQSLGPSLRQRLFADGDGGCTSFLQRLLSMLVAAGTSTSAWSKEARLVTDLGLTRNDCTLLKTACVEELRRSFGQSFTAAHDEAWGLAFTILEEVSELDIYCTTP
eukprot:GGOE01014727.1.p1 GENE.GGOE01014727.1~~GGOE01014727.1.p1  ORF type:complete len:1016 (-),score=352.54 GGOE01014727.1:281-3259(-)